MEPEENIPNIQKKKTNLMTDLLEIMQTRRQWDDNF